MFGDITPRDQHGLIEIRIEIRLHPGVRGIFRPAHKVIHRLLGPVGVIDLQPVPFGGQVAADFHQLQGRFPRKQRHGLLIPVDPVADEIESGIVSDLQDHVRDQPADRNESARVI